MVTMLKSYCKASMNNVTNHNCDEDVTGNAVGRNDVTVGRNDVTVGRNDVTVGRNDVTVGRNDVTVGRNDVTVGRNDKRVPESSRILRRFKMNSTAKYSITRPFEANQISSYIISSIVKDLHKNPTCCTITDGTAGVGGDVINLCKHFGYVNAVEKDPDTYSLLLQNLYEFDVSNVKTYKKDYLSMMYELKQDVLYIDPPWGGVHYKELDECPLYLSDKEIGTIIKELFKLDPNLLIFLKAPLNIKRDSFKKYIKDVIPIFNRADITSFILIKIKNSQSLIV